MTKHQRYEKLLEFVKWISSRSCCNVCECMACDATKLLRELGLDNNEKKKQDDIFFRTLPKTIGCLKMIEYPSLDKIIRSHITTKEAAYYLNRSPKTLRTWACFENGPIRPIRICGRLAWPVDEIRNILSKYLY